VEADLHHVMAQPGHQQSAEPCHALFGPQPQEPDLRCLLEQACGQVQALGAQLLEGAGEVGDLEVEMRADRLSEMPLRRGPDRIAIGFGAVALLAGLLSHLVEVGIAQAPEQPCCRGLGHLGEIGHLGGRVGEDVVLALENEARQLLLGGRKPIIAILYAEAEANGHGFLIAAGSGHFPDDKLHDM